MRIKHLTKEKSNNTYETFLIYFTAGNTACKIVAYKNRKIFHLVLPKHNFNAYFGRIFRGYNFETTVVLREIIQHKNKLQISFYFSGKLR